MTPHRSPFALAAAACMTLCAAAAVAEVSVLKDQAGRCTGTLESYDRSTAPPRYWTPVRGNADQMLLLNPAGDSFRDGRPSVVMNPVTGWPEAVWSYWDGGDYEIAWSRFDGTSWKLVVTPAGPDFEFLTDNQSQDLDPRLWIDHLGTRHVTWWRLGPQGINEIIFTRLPAGETQWWLPSRISQEGVSTSRPDIRTVRPWGTFIAAQERNAASETSVVVLEEPPVDPRRPPQRGSDPWGRFFLRTAGDELSLGVQIGEVGAPGGAIPVISWRDGGSLLSSYFDPEASTWAAPVISPLPPAW